LSLNNEEIENLIDKYERDSKAFRDEALRICWYMRGGLSYSETMMLSKSERDIISKIIKDNMETTKESGLPFF
jgi:hypothetical protein